MIGISIFVPGSRDPVTDFDDRSLGASSRARMRHDVDESGDTSAIGNMGHGSSAAPDADTETQWINNQTFEASDALPERGSMHNGPHGQEVADECKLPPETPSKAAFLDAFMSVDSVQPTPMVSGEPTPRRSAHEERAGAPPIANQSEHAHEVQGIVEFDKYGIDMDSHLSDITDPKQREAVLTLASGHINRAVNSYARRAKKRIDTLRGEHDDAVSRLDAALTRDIDETRRATAQAIQMDAKKFEKEQLPAILKMLRA